jgi:VWFA-related protein
MTRSFVPLSLARLVSALMFIGCLTLQCAAQSPALKPVSQQAEARPPAPSLTLHTYSRMVTLEVVVKDGKGNHVTGLKPEDFQVFEQTPKKSREKREQKIATFREVSMADLEVHDSGLAAQIPAGISTNVVASLKEPIPPTIILVDGLNTDPHYQAQVHVRMLKMLQQIPPDVPVAVFLLGSRLEMVQDFTTDPKLLQAALRNLTTPAGVGLATVDPRDDPHSLSNEEQKSGMFTHDLIESAREFELKTFAADMDSRVNRTIEALLEIGRHVAGYPGRKNLLWLSTAFPIALAPIGEITAAGQATGGRSDMDFGKIFPPGTSWAGMFDPDAGKRDYSVKIERLSAALSDSRVAVYPVNIGGVQTPHLYEAETIPGLNGPAYNGPAYMEDAVIRDDRMRGYERETMHSVADGTGGAVCLGDNDLADCIHKAVDDSSKFYEIAYYPDSKDWNGEYRRISLDTKSKGLHLEYRQGYFANPEGSEAGAKDDLQRAACEGPLDATAIFLAAKSLPPDPKETMKFYLMINPAALTYTAAGGGNREVNLRVGVCTFDETGKPLHYMSDSVDQKLTAKQFQELIHGGLPHVVAVAGPKPAAVRLAVMDEASGKVGSVFVKTDGPVIASASSSSPAQSPPQTKQ